MKDWKQTKIIISVITFVILVTLIFISNTNAKQFGVLNNISTSMASPIYKFSRKRELKSESETLGKNLQNILNENEKLKKEIEEPRLKSNEIDVLKSKNDELAELLGIKDSYKNYEGIPAQVVSKSISNYEKTAITNAGEDKGIKENMIAVAAKGLYGRVITVSKNTSKVQLITDPASKITVRVGNSAESLIAEGNLENGLILTMLPQNSRIISEQYIYTSGMGGVFPGGIYVGRVADIIYKSNESNSYVTVNTAIDPNSVRNLLVLTNQNEKNNNNNSNNSNNSKKNNDVNTDNKIKSQKIEVQNTENAQQ